MPQMQQDSTSLCVWRCSFLVVRDSSHVVMYVRVQMYQVLSLDIRSVRNRSRQDKQEAEADNIIHSDDTGARAPMKLEHLGGNSTHNTSQEPLVHQGSRTGAASENQQVGGRMLHVVLEGVEVRYQMLEDRRTLVAGGCPVDPKWMQPYMLWCWRYLVPEAPVVYSACYQIGRACCTDKTVYMIISSLYTKNEIIFRDALKRDLAAFENRLHIKRPCVIFAMISAFNIDDTNKLDTS